MIIDCHTHLNRYSPDAPATLQERYAALRRQMDENNIAYALVLTSYTVSADRPSTPEVLELARNEPRIGVVGGIQYDMDPVAQVKALRTHLGAHGLKGIKLYPGYDPFSADDPKLRDVYALAAEFDVPVMIHTGDTYASRARLRFAHPLQVDEVAVEFPKTTFVICHLGNPWFTDAMAVVYKNKNVFADISGLTLNAFEERFERFVARKLNDVIAYINDPSKLLFGSDWPLSDIASYLGFVQQLDLKPEEREGLLWRNAARLFRIDLSKEKGGA